MIPSSDYKIMLRKYFSRTNQRVHITFDEVRIALRPPHYVKQTSRPQWGIGRVISIGDSEKVTIFFLRGGKRIIQGSSPALEYADDHHPILEIAGSANWDRADPNLYVVELKPKIFDWEQRFMAANLHWIPGKRCVYVGMSGLTPEERFRSHLCGQHAAWFVQKYGLRLLPELYQHFNPLPYELAQQMEPELARQLRADGLPVWQN
jgi:hypothetical protein